MIHGNLITSINEASLGSLCPSEFEEIARDGSMVINGVEIPPNVVRQLKDLGMPLASYTAGELREAVNACITDGVLIQDEDGVNFFDKLKLDENERAQQEGDIEKERHRRDRPRSKRENKHHKLFRSLLIGLQDDDCDDRLPCSSHDEHEIGCIKPTVLPFEISLPSMGFFASRDDDSGWSRTLAA